LAPVASTTQKGARQTRAATAHGRAPLGSVVALSAGKIHGSKVVLGASAGRHRAPDRLNGPEVARGAGKFHGPEVVLGAGRGRHRAPDGLNGPEVARGAGKLHSPEVVLGTSVHPGSGVARGLYSSHHRAPAGNHCPTAARCPGLYPALRSGRFGSPQGPKKNQIQWTVLDSPGRKTTPLFRGKAERSACVPSRDQIRLCGFDSRRLRRVHSVPPTNLHGASEGRGPSPLWASPTQRGARLGMGRANSAWLARGTLRAPLRGGARPSERGSSLTATNAR